MRKFKLLVFLVGASLSLMIAATVFAQAPALPHRFAGTAGVDGAAAADGAAVTAWIDGKEVAAATVAGGNYRIDIVQPAGESYAGKKVAFKVGLNDAAQTGTWEVGGGTVLNLTASTGAAPGATPPPGALVIDLVEQNASGQSGWAALTAKGAQTEVVLNLSAGTLESEMVHIHSGSCGTATLGGVVHVLTSFVGGAGGSVTLVDASLSSLQTGGFAINSHQKGNPGTYTSCGSIPADQPAPTAKPAGTPELDPRVLPLIKAEVAKGVASAISAADAALFPALQTLEPVFARSGPKGDPGAAGPAGPAGRDGPAGAAGSPGQTGPRGDGGVGGVQGSSGQTGPQGAGGVGGVQGNTGGFGPVGPQGEMGGSGVAIVALILGIVALVAAGAMVYMGKTHKHET